MDINYYKQFEPINGKWYITKKLGQGAFGTVFEIVRKDDSRMKAALKVISVPTSQNEVDSYREENYNLDEQSISSYFYGFVEEFKKEFQIMSMLKGNSNIVSYEDHDEIKRSEGIGWDIFIRMELLTPMNKYECFANNKYKYGDVIKLGIDICKALEICQQYKIIHRDIKPSNIFVSDTGNFKLGDFGVARTLEKTSSALSKKGTYTYMAPEIYKGEKYNANVDLYSLGIVMYKLLNNNREPFRSDSISHSDIENALYERMQGKQIPPPKNAHGKLAQIVLKACSFNPLDRYENPAQMRAELESVLADSELAEKVVNMTDEEPKKPQDENEPTKTGIEPENPPKTPPEILIPPEPPKDLSADNEWELLNNKGNNGFNGIEIINIANSAYIVDMASNIGITFTKETLKKILPIFNYGKSVSDCIKMNSFDMIRKRINITETENLLSALKVLVYYEQFPANKEVIAPVRIHILQVLKIRPKEHFAIDPVVIESRINHAVNTASERPAKERVSIGNAYLNFWKKYFDFKGCTSRREFWTVILINFIITMIVGIIGVGIYISGNVELSEDIMNNYRLIMFIPHISLCTRRLHDTGRSGHWQWLHLTYIGSISILIFCCMDSVWENNKYRKDT